RKGGTQSHWPTPRHGRDRVAGLPGNRRPPHGCRLRTALEEVLCDVYRGSAPLLFLLRSPSHSVQAWHPPPGCLSIGQTPTTKTASELSTSSARPKVHDNGLSESTIV